MVGFSRWAMELLISLTNDLDIVVARTAVQIIDEACDEKANLDVLVQANPSLQHLSPTAEFLTARILGTVQGFNSSSELVKLELVKWRTTFNRRYVTTVEQLLNSKLLASDFSNQRWDCICNMHFLSLG
jgi:rapamycin-insensitive companion of mTOR